MSWSGKNETSRKSLVSWKLSIIQRLVDRECVQTILSRRQKMNFSKFPKDACVIEHSIFALQLFVPTFF